jgi:hypothetical protein
MSFDVILPFLRPVERLIKDPEVSEIMVNAPTRVFIERSGRLEEVPGVRSRKSLCRWPCPTANHRCLLVGGFGQPQAWLGMRSFFGRSF